MGLFFTFLPEAWLSRERREHRGLAAAAGDPDALNLGQPSCDKPAVQAAGFLLSELRNYGDGAFN
jgi:hypothetical protein